MGQSVCRPIPGGSNLVDYWPGLVLVLDQNPSAYTDAGAGACSAWANYALSQLIDGATQSVASQRPTIATAPNRLVFDGTTDGLELGTTALFTGACTVGIRFKLNALPAGGTYMNLLTLVHSATRTFFEVGCVNIGGYQPYTFGAKITAGGITMRGIANALDTSTHYLVVTYDNGSNVSNASYTARLDGAAQAVAASSAFSRDTTDIASVGARIVSALGAPAHRLNGAIHKVVVCDQVLTGADLTTLETYLSTDAAA
jgi:hypothetical protein